MAERILVDMEKLRAALQWEFTLDELHERVPVILQLVRDAAVEPTAPLTELAWAYLTDEEKTKLAEDGRVVLRAFSKAIYNIFHTIAQTYQEWEKKEKDVETKSARNQKG